MRSAKEIIIEGLELHRQGNRIEAQKIYDKMLGMLDEPDPSLLVGYGLLLAQDNHHGLAKHFLMEASRLIPDYAPVWCNLGVSMKNLGRDEAALACYEKALKLDPTMCEAWSNLAGYYINSGTPEQAEVYARKALSFGDTPSAHNHLALSLMEQGKFEEAWEHWESRWDLPERIPFRRPFTFPKWDGKKTGTLVIHGEQGLGDEILYMSVLDRVRPLADWIFVECSPRLVPLFSRSFDLDCFPNAESLLHHHHHFDAWIPMGSLWRFTGLPDGRPFLSPHHPAKSHDKPRIGISWKGGLPRTHKKLRTIKLAQLRPILDIEGLEFVGLQYGGDEVVKEAAEQGLKMPEDRSFDALVEEINNCDLVITVCQTNVHIAGGLGKPCWVLTPHACAWRYSGKTHEMKFYKSVSLYRQNSDQEWSPVIASIASDLRRRYA